MTAVQGEAVKYLKAENGEDRVLDAVIEAVVGSDQADLLVTLDGSDNKMRVLGAKFQSLTAEDVPTYTGGEVASNEPTGPAMGPEPVAPTPADQGSPEAGQPGQPE